jgi:hypothetical protein
MCHLLICAIYWYLLSIDMQACYELADLLHGRARAMLEAVPSSLALLPIKGSGQIGRSGVDPTIAAMQAGMSEAEVRKCDACMGLMLQ